MPYLTQTIVTADVETGIKATRKRDQYTLVHRKSAFVMAGYTPNQVTYTTADMETFTDEREMDTRCKELGFQWPRPDISEDVQPQLEEVG